MKAARVLLIAGTLVASSTLFGFAASSSQPGAPDIVAHRGASIDVPVITVSGSGEVEKKPDYAVIVVGVQSRQKTAGAASENVGANMKQVVEAIRKLELTGMQLQTSGATLNPAYTWSTKDGEQKQTLVGYDASSTIRVRVEDPSKIGAVIDASVSAGANTIHSISFELKGALEARNEAVTMAAQAARQKAETLAAALGLRITRVITATTDADTRPWQPMSNTVAFAREQAQPGMGETIEPGMVTVRANATVSFAAEPIR